MKEVKYIVTEDLTLAGGHTVKYTDDVLQNCTLESNIISWINATPIKLMIKSLCYPKHSIDLMQLLTKF